MGKKPRSSKAPIKIPKNSNKKPITDTILKTLRPKVYIVDSSNFKTLVQQLTGDKDSSSPVLISPPSSSISQPVQIIQDQQIIHNHTYQENSWDLSFDSSGFSTPLESSPDLTLGSSTPLESSPDLCLPERLEFMSSYGDIESLLMEMDLDLYNACYAMI